MEKLEAEILKIFQEKGSGAYSALSTYLSPASDIRKRILVRNTLSRLYVNDEGVYFLKAK